MSGKEVHRYTAQIESTRALFGTRNRGTELTITSYFSDLVEFLVKIDQGTKVHKYRTKNLPEMELFGSGTEVQRYTANISQGEPFLGPSTEVQRCRA